MGAGKHSSSEITISLEDSPEGTPRLITAFILTMGAAKITANMQKTTAYGALWDTFLPTGLSMVDKFTLTGLWDDSAGGLAPHTVFLTPDVSPTAGTRALVIVFGNARTFTVETLLESYAVTGAVNKLTEFAAVLQPSGAAVWS